MSRQLPTFEAWYDSAIERVSGRYKRANQKVIFVVAVATTVAFNINAITLADQLYRDPVIRASVTEAAKSAPAPTTYAAASEQLSGLHLAIGWDAGWGAPLARSLRPAGEECSVWQDLFGPLLGWLITALAATLGAPFWFDIASRFTMLRSSKKPEARPTSAPLVDVVKVEQVADVRALPTPKASSVVRSS